MITKIITLVKKYQEMIFEAQDYIWKHAETGYKEQKTTAYMERSFEKLGYDLVKAKDIPGFYTVIDTGRSGPEVLILGELDAIVCAEHPDANPDTGAAHCCGHSAQCAALLGIAAVLKEPGILDGLSGRIRLCAVPAEELIEIEYRKELKEQGRIHYMGGKTEFLYRGYFDGVDLAFMVHTTTSKNKEVLSTAVGCLAKRVTYQGIPAHAGGCPWNGRNALYAATLGLSAVNSIRETFKEEDVIRVHPIITQGGGAVNTIPDKVVIESYVRGSSFKAIRDANKRVNRALCGTALSLGVNIDICDIPGYAPVFNDEGMMLLAKEASECLPDIPFVWKNVVDTVSTDMGDLSMVMPVVHAYMPGASGTAHGSDYQIENPELACVGSAIWQLTMLKLLLENDAKRAREIIANSNPQFCSKAEFFNYINQFTFEGNRINYDKEDNVTIIL